MKLEGDKEMDRETHRGLGKAHLSPRGFAGGMDQGTDRGTGHKIPKKDKEKVRGQTRAQSPLPSQKSS